MPSRFRVGTSKCCYLDSLTHSTHLLAPNECGRETGSPFAQQCVHIIAASSASCFHSMSQPTHDRLSQAPGGCSAHRARAKEHQASRVSHTISLQTAIFSARQVPHGGFACRAFQADRNQTLLIGPPAVPNKSPWPSRPTRLRSQLCMCLQRFADSARECQLQCIYKQTMYLKVASARTAMSYAMSASTANNTDLRLATGPACALTS